MQKWDCFIQFFDVLGFEKRSRDLGEELLGEDCLVNSTFFVLGGRGLVQNFNQLQDLLSIIM